MTENEIIGILNTFKQKINCPIIANMHCEIINAKQFKVIAHTIIEKLKDERTLNEPNG